VSRRCKACEFYRPDDSWQPVYWPCSREAKGGEPTTTPPRVEYIGVPVPVLDVEFVRDLIALTHLDRHPAERSRLASETTARLFELLDRLRAVEAA
jgi:hypothetical protein